MGYNLFLDDVRIPEQVGNYILPTNIREQYRKEKWLIVRNSDEFISAIMNRGLPNKVSFDHDLADVHYDPRTWTESFKYQEATGYDLAKWLVNYCIDNNFTLPIYYCHSMNSVGRENILSLLNNYKEKMKVNE